MIMKIVSMTMFIRLVTMLVKFIQYIEIMIIVIRKTIIELLIKITMIIIRMVIN